MSGSHPEANDSNEHTKYIDDLVHEDDVDAVVKAMLMENTGRHFLDSGSAYGRNHEENRKTPPWEKPRYIVESGYVVQNLFDHLTEQLERDPAARRLEEGLLRYGATPEESSEAWLRTTERYAERHHDGDRGPQSFNTYNHEFGSLTQCVQGVGFTHEGENYIAVQVHGGCDIRGGYTKPRVFNGSWRCVIPMEFQFWCRDCEWSEAESCIDWEVLEDMTIPEANELECPECGSHDVMP